MDFLRLQVFRAVARQQSFSRAAVDLHLSQPAVSKHIRQLEAELGSQLFRRLGNRVELTDAGRIVADYAQRVSMLTEEVRRVLGELGVAARLSAPGRQHDAGSISIAQHAGMLSKEVSRRRHDVGDHQ